MHQQPPDPVGDQRDLLTQTLDYQRAVMLGKVAGLDRAQMAATTAASSLTLAGLLKHLALVEDHWFSVVLAGREPEETWRDIDWEADPDWEFRTATDEEPDELVALYERACARSRAEVAAVSDLSALSIGRTPTRGPFTMAWILVHMIEETARHNGHADLLREAIDGVTGD